MAIGKVDLDSRLRDIKRYDVESHAHRMSLLSSLSIHSLLLLRLALEQEHETIDIEQDIQDLYLFPDRLASSYPDEWRAYVKLRLAKLNISEPRMTTLLLGESAPNNDQEQLLFHKLRQAKPRYQRLFHVIDNTQTALDSDNIVALQTPLHRWLAWAIS